MLRIGQIKCDKQSFTKLNLNPSMKISDLEKPNISKHKELFADYCDLSLTVDNLDEVVLNIFNNIVKFAETEWETRLIKSDTLHPEFKSSSKHSPYYENMHIMIDDKQSDYDDYNIISSYFTDTVRAKGKKDSISVYDFYGDVRNKGLILHVAKSRVKNYYDLTYQQKIYEVRESVYHLFGKRYECTSHRVLIPLIIYKLFDAKKILDYSAGWGDRGIAAMSIGAEYTGIDPNPALHSCYAKMLDLFKPANKVQFLQMCAEDHNTDEEYDIMYTSPPYFTMEKYSENRTQSINRYKTYNDWKQGFYFRMLDNAVKHVKHDGHIAINIINWVNKNPHPKATFVANFPMLDDMIDYMISINQVFLGFIYYKISVPIAIFKVVHLGYSQ